jgi:F0F1-type ATP synthase assembly protein I
VYAFTSVHEQPDVDNGVGVERGKVQTVAGRGDGFTQAVELVLSTAVFAAIGWFLDRHFGTAPIFAVTLAALALVGNVAKLYFTYTAAMRAESEGKPWARQR